MRITQEDLDSAVGVYARNLEALGMLKHPVQLQIGSKVNGIAFRLFFVTEHGGVKSAPGTSNGYLGTTKREAHDRLWMINRTLGDVEYYLNGSEG